jgi:hypothetical protein
MEVEIVELETFGQPFFYEAASVQRAGHRCRHC